MLLVNACEMQAADRTTIEKLGIPGLILMENAGRGVFENILRRLKADLYKGTIVIAGPGNNGGDGFVVARYLYLHNFPVRCIVLSEREKFKGDALTNLNIIEKLGIKIDYITSSLDNIDLKKLMNLNALNCGVIVDAIFGTGLKREVKGRFKEIIEFINNTCAKIISVDISSGLSSDNGLLMGCAVKADMTVTMAAPKVGHVVYPGSVYTGRLEVVDIGIPQKVLSQQEAKGELLDNGTIRSLMIDRPSWANKGVFGHLLIIAGSKGKTGAAALCSLGALRSGAGLVTVAAPQSAMGVIASILPVEAMTLAISDDESTGEFSHKAAEELSDAIAYRKKAIVIGPGVGLTDIAVSVQNEIIRKCPIPIVIDADALTAISRQRGEAGDGRGGDVSFSVLKGRIASTVLTPHPGEMGRLLSISPKEVQADRLKYAMELADKSNSVVVLKGQGTIIACQDGRFSVNTTGNAGMAQGGMGDVLSGIIGALLSQGYDAYNAARIGVFVHGLAADILYKMRGPFGFGAREVSEMLPNVWKQLCPVDCDP